VLTQGKRIGFSATQKNRHIQLLELRVRLVGPFAISVNPFRTLEDSFAITAGQLLTRPEVCSMNSCAIAPANRRLLAEGDVYG
jgi:hypothetical protein